MLLRDLARWHRAVAFPIAPAALIMSLPILCLRIDPELAGPGEPAKMLEYVWLTPDFPGSYFAPLVLHDSGGPLRNIVDMRAFPIPGGLRIVGLRRDFVGDAVWDSAPPGLQGTLPRARFTQRLRLGLPCWLPGVRCTQTGNNTLPPAPYP
jgi:hypothetical protein